MMGRRLGQEDLDAMAELDAVQDALSTEIVGRHARTHSGIVLVDIRPAVAIVDGATLAYRADCRECDWLGWWPA